MHGLWEYTILKALELRGNEIFIVNCDGLLPDCDIHWNATNPRTENSCRYCMDAVSQLNHAFGFKPQNLKDHLLQHEIVYANSITEACNLKDVSFKGINLFSVIETSVHQHYRSHEIDFDDPLVRKTIRNYMVGALISYFSMDRYFSRVNPDILFLFNGRMSTTKMAFQLAQSYGIETVVHERGYLKNTVVLHHNADSSDVKYISDCWNRDKNSPLSNNQKNKINAYLEERAEGTNLNWDRFSPMKSNSVKKIYEDLSIKESDKVFLLFNSSDDEVAVDIKYCSKIFENQIEWIKETIDIFTDKKEKLIIRVHPGIGSESSTGVNLHALAFFKDLKDKVNKYPNIIIIDSDSDISTYDLMDIADVGLNWWSTCGLELACRGKPVINTEAGFFGNCTFLDQIESRTQYLNLVDKYIHNGCRLSLENIESAKSFYYRWIFEWNQFPLSLIDMPDPHNGLLAYNDLSALMPGANKDLDRIVNYFYDIKS